MEGEHKHNVVAYTAKQINLINGRLYIHLEHTGNVTKDEVQERLGVGTAMHTFVRLNSLP
jgi:hypothetical protein